MASSPDKTRLLFVCLGNICRSPTAEGVARAKIQDAGLAERIYVDSAGTYGGHTGEAPDPRAQAAAQKRGYDLAPLRARKITADDFKHFDYILAMDKENFQELRRLADQAQHSKISLLMSHSIDNNRWGREVPDPYYGGKEGFEQVLDMVESAVDGLLGKVKIAL